MIPALLAICIGSSSCAQPPPESIVQQFEELTLAYEKAGVTAKYKYYLHRPSRLQHGVAYPFIVWLHGYGREEFDEVGTGILRHIQNLLDQPTMSKQNNFFVLALQCPRDQRRFFVANNAKEKLEPGEVIIQLTRRLLQELPIDADRVTCVGISGGGTAAWVMGKRYPDVFAGIAPLASDGTTLDGVEVLASTSIWAFNYRDDTVASSDRVEASVQAIRQAGGLAELTLLDGNEHASWEAAFNNYDLRGWLLSQNRIEYFSRRPGSVPHTWPEMALQIGLPALFAIAAWKELSRQKKRGMSRRSS